MGLIVTTTFGGSAAATDPEKNAVNKTRPARNRAGLNVAIEDPLTAIKIV